jgi:hypothetical protein
VSGDYISATVLGKNIFPSAGLSPVSLVLAITLRFIVLLKGMVDIIFHCTVTLSIVNSQYSKFLPKERGERFQRYENEDSFLAFNAGFRSCCCPVLSYPEVLSYFHLLLRSSHVFYNLDSVYRGINCSELKV